MVMLTLPMIVMPPRKFCPGKMVSRSGPIAAMRSCTDFWAPDPSASMVITAPTPMMMPSAVSSDRSLFARIACSATLKISSSSIAVLAVPGRGAAGAARRGGLLTQARQPATGHALEAVTHVLLRLHERGTRQEQHGVLLGEAARHLDVIEVGQAGADVDRRGLAVAQREHDVARGEGAAAAHLPGPEGAAALAATPGAELSLDVVGVEAEHLRGGSDVALRTQRGIGDRQHALALADVHFHLGVHAGLQ